MKHLIACSFHVTHCTLNSKFSSLTYNAGDIINQAYANRHCLSEYTFQLCEGPEMTKTFSIIPTEFWSFGPILNHADDGKLHNLLLFLLFLFSISDTIQ
jgi:hypothetical protein